MKVERFADQATLASVLSEVRTGHKGMEDGSSYAHGLAKVEPVVSLVRDPRIVNIARELLKLEGPLGYLSLTALTVQPGSVGMPGHVDYPHFHPSCPNDVPLVAQFVLALDGTTEGAAPTWVTERDLVVELEPGDLFAFLGTEVHGVLPNTSSRPRTNLLWSIGPAWIKPMQISLFHMTIDDVSPSDLIRKDTR